MVGLFFAIDGPDGAGISTQVRLLADYLSSAGRRVVPTKEPSTGPVGNLLRQVLTGRLHHVDGSRVDEALLALLFSADRLDHLKNEIEPALSRGFDIVCDRYILSTLAYQSQQEDLAWLAVLNERARRPDLTFVLDVSAETSMRRIHESRSETERYESVEQLAAIRASFQALANRPQSDAIGDVVLIDGAPPIDEVHARIRQIAHRYLEPA